MSHFINNSLEVHILWARHNEWEQGQSRDWPCYGHCLWLMKEGEVEVWCGQQCWRVRRDQVFLFPQGMPRRLVAAQKSHWITVGLSATTPTQTDLFGELSLPALQTLAPSEQIPLLSWLETIADIYQQSVSYIPVSSKREMPNPERPSHFEMIEDSLAKAVVAWCWGLWGPMDLEPAIQHQSPSWLAKTLERVRDNPKVSIAELAKAANFSPAQFRRLFHQNMRQSPQQYLLYQRLEFAQVLLETTDLPIAEVAVNSGFPTPTNFMNLWKRTRGMSALQYRLSQRAARKMEVS